MNERYIKCYAMPRRIKRLILCYSSLSAIVNIATTVFYLVVYFKSFYYEPDIYHDWYSKTLEKISFEVSSAFRLISEENLTRNTSLKIDILPNCHLLLSSSTKIVLNVSAHIFSMIGVIVSFILTLGFIEGLLVFLWIDKFKHFYLTKIVTIGQVVVLTFYGLVGLLILLKKKLYLVICMVSILSLLLIGTVTAMTLVILHHIAQIRNIKFRKDVLDALEVLKTDMTDDKRSDYERAVEKRVYTDF